MKEIRILKKWAVDHYNSGGSYFLDSWEDDDYKRVLDEEGSLEAAIVEMQRIADIWDERCVVWED